MKQQHLVFSLATEFPIHSALRAAKSAPRWRASALLRIVQAVDNIEDPTIHDLCLVFVHKHQLCLFCVCKQNH